MAMKNFRDYEELIRETVKKISDEDPNWTWTVKSFAKYRVRIRWSYLDYLEEEENCFFLCLEDFDEDADRAHLITKTPRDHTINVHLINDDRSSRRTWEESWERALSDSIYEIADFAHSRY